MTGTAAVTGMPIREGHSLENQGRPERLPIALLTPAPPRTERAALPAGRRPVIALLDTGFTGHGWVSAGDPPDDPFVLAADWAPDRQRRGEAEVRAIAAGLPAGLRACATVLTGDGATPAATLAALDGAGLAHIAAHGRHEPDNALFSAVELAGGPLMGHDIQRLRRTPPHVVLSACDLGLADVRPGDETLGMVAALLSSGSSTP